jgi:calcium-dependent protein kinase
MWSVVGTPYYMAPEILTRKYGPECDIWSVGVIMHLMISGVLPFVAENRSELFRKIRRDPVDLTTPEWSTISNSAKSLISKLLIKDPAKRIKIQDALAHRWFTTLETK